MARKQKASLRKKIAALHRQTNLLGEAMARLIEAAAGKETPDPREQINLMWQAQQYRDQFAHATFTPPDTLVEARRQMRHVRALVAGAFKRTKLKKKDLAAAIDDLASARGYCN
jgi:Ser/Thr protein kinase RdoA (MazF antagonist)